ncbi:MAG: hypothetical protein HZC36_12010 [Armatimonadetes bacterium]|nr:hypothetical protein [Armatimonadota bacterium]
MKRPSNLKSALSETPNLLGLASAFALSAAFLNPLPLMAGLALEAGYLLFAPDSKWYNGLLEKRYQLEVERRRADLKKRVFPFLSPKEQIRYNRLEENRANIQPIDRDRPFLRDVLKKLDYLLEKYLLFAAKRLEFQNYLIHVHEQVIPERAPAVPAQFDLGSKKGKKGAPPPSPPSSDDTEGLEAWAKAIVDDVQDFYRNENDRLNRQSVDEENLHNKALLDKRIEIMNRRALYVQQIADIFDNLTNQMKLMEDTLGLISDEIRARSPEQVIAEIDSVVSQSDILTEALSEMTPFDEMPVAQGASRLYNLPNK